MNRRDVLHGAGIGLVASALPFSTVADENQDLTAVGVNRYLRDLVDVKEPSVDRVIAGDPSTRVQKIGTAWMPYWKTLRRAVDDGVNVLIVHEPTFYTHWDLDDSLKGMPEPARSEYLSLRDQKRRWIEEHGLVVIRCHDVLDKVRQFGIPFAFGQVLGFSNATILRSEMYYNVYAVEKQSALNMARHIARKLKPLNQPGVAFYGDADYSVQSVGLGTGCICDPTRYAGLKPDLMIAIDDSVQTWVQTTFAEDTGKPLVVVNHGTSEEYGMQLLSEQLRKAFPAIPVSHYAQGCGYRWVE